MNNLLTDLPVMDGRAVLLDLDGTLVDSAPDIAAAVNRMLADLGAPPLPLQKVRSFIGRGVPTLLARVLEASGRAYDARRACQLFHLHYHETNGRHGGVYPGVREGLEALAGAGYPLACVTNKPYGLAEELLRLTGLEAHFELLVGGDTVTPMKPAPEPLWYACRMLGADPIASLLVGDSPVDAAAAQAAGMPVYLMRYGYHAPAVLEELPSRAILDSLAQLPALLQVEMAGCGS
jgi:phosphoglycolate phosphatase